MRFSVYGERSLWKFRSFYNELLAYGMSFTMYLN